MTITLPLQTQIHCPWCKTSVIRNEGRHGGFVYYRCMNNGCSFPPTNKPARFKILAVEKK